MSWLQNQAISIALPYLLGPLVFFVMQGLKKASAFIDNLPPWAKQGAVFVIAQAITFAQSFSGQDLACGTSCTIADLGAPFVKGLLVSLSAFLMHWLKQRQPSK